MLLPIWLFLAVRHQQSAAFAIAVLMVLYVMTASANVKNHVVMAATAHPPAKPPAVRTIFVLSNVKTKMIAITTRTA